MKYVYNGPGPHEDPVLGLIRPGDEREFGEEPAWGPWLPLPGEDAESDPPPPVTVTPVTPPQTPPAAGSEPPAADSGGM